MCRDTVYVLEDLGTRGVPLVGCFWILEPVLLLPLLATWEERILGMICAGILVVDV